jgi:hypothetical protein
MLENCSFETKNLEPEKIHKPKVLAIIRSGINSVEYKEEVYDPNYPELSAEELFLQSLKNAESYDQITNLSSNGEILERKNLKYLNFLKELNEQDRIRHETIHPLVFDLAKEIFGEIEDIFDYRVELVVGGFDWFLKNTMKDSGSVISFTFEGENQITFYYFIFQFALANAIKDSFWDKPSAKENQQRLYNSFNKLIQKVNKTRKENSQNYKPNQDIILDYTECLNLLPKITKHDILSNIIFLRNTILSDKQLPFKFAGFNFDDFEIWLKDLDGEKLLSWINKDSKL